MWWNLLQYYGHFGFAFPTYHISSTRTSDLFVLIDDQSAKLYKNTWTFATNGSFSRTFAIDDIPSLYVQRDYRNYYIKNW